MKVETKGHTTTIKDTQGDLETFVSKLTNEYNSFKGQNLIIDLSKYEGLTVKDLNIFTDLAGLQKKDKRSFVLVTEGIDFNKVPAKFTAVPTRIEAHDIIEMDEIERDLGF
jgi:hypothetical protein